MRTLTYRLSGKQVHYTTVVRMLRTLLGLREANALAFIDFVRRCKDREHVLSKASAALLLDTDMISSQGKNYRLHDVWTELVRECTEGDGLKLKICWGFKEEPQLEPEQTARLTDGTMVCKATAQGLVMQLHRLHNGDPTALPELYRMLTLKNYIPYDPALDTLESSGLLIRDEAVEQGIAMTSAGPMLARITTKAYAVPDVVAQVTTLLLKGHQRGFPVLHGIFAEEPAAAAGSNGKARENGRAKHPRPEAAAAKK